MISSIQNELRRIGFDLCHPIHTSWYNDLIRDEGMIINGALEKLPEPSATLDCPDVQENTKCNALLIGNTKRVWPLFLDWLGSKVDQEKSDNRSFTDREALERISSPFDTFVKESILQVLQRCCECHLGLNSCELFWSDGERQKLNKQFNDYVHARAKSSNHCYVNEGKSFLVSLPRVAMTTGQYWQDAEATKLCVHQEYGTWTAFRVVVVFEAGGPSCPAPLAPPPCPSPVADDEIEMAKTLFDYALRKSSADERGYGTTLNKSWSNLCEYLHGTVCSGRKWEDVPDTMKPWIQMRDCFGVGRKKWKYNQEQLLYHYTKDCEILTMELERINGACSP